ncbi:hypothetical protein K2173_008202 [Erythroxylum novogranatense]|uniref:Uncharacterized protein n=1 Tax=Erythroxylum novogranatense TaxID=1862640 RepID=A0AAV8U8Y3_9ROSI|nr:hypothetical protein K2173_008202 [Erythroxylum novogranatense]
MRNGVEVAAVHEPTRKSLNRKSKPKVLVLGVRIKRVSSTLEKLPKRSTQLDLHRYGDLESKFSRDKAYNFKYGSIFT